MTNRKPTKPSVIFLAVLVALGCNVRPKPALTPGEQLLDESESIERNIKGQSLQEHSVYLLTLCRTSAELHSYKTEDRCLQAFASATRVESGCERDRLQAASLVALSEVNPSLALKRMGQMPKPSPCGPTDDKRIAKDHGPIGGDEP